VAAEEGEPNPAPWRFRHGKPPGAISRFDAPAKALPVLPLAILLLRLALLRQSSLRALGMKPALRHRQKLPRLPEKWRS
jgi:hypothetical protein